jgi:hypothetical protein
MKYLFINFCYLCLFNFPWLFFYSLGLKSGSMSCRCILECLLYMCSLSP